MSCCDPNLAIWDGTTLQRRTVLKGAVALAGVLGATLVVTAWAAVIAAFLLRAEPSRAGRPAWLRLSPWMALAGISLLSAAFVIVVVVALAIHQGRLDAIEIGHAFVGAASAIVGTILLCVATLLIALHDVDLDRPGRGRAETRTPAAVTAS